LNLKHGEQLSNFASNNSLRRYNKVIVFSDNIFALREYATALRQGLTLVHFSAQRKHILWHTLGA